MSETSTGRQEQAPQEAPAIINVTEDDFEAAVVAASHARPVLVDIGADWCGPCRVLGPRLHALAQARGGEFLLANVDADENMRIAGRHKVRGFPTVIAYSHGVEIDRFHSAQTDGFLRRFVDDVLRHHAEHGHAALLMPAPAGAGGIGTPSLVVNNALLLNNPPFDEIKRRLRFRQS